MSDADEEVEEHPFVIFDDESLEDEHDDPPEKHEDELDGLRIHQLAHLRRSNYRSQTYAIVGMLACGVAAAKLILLARDSYIAALWLYTAAYGVTAVGGAIGAILFAFNADRLRQENKQRPDQTDHEPDFEPLSDGSQHVQNLQDMQEREEPQDPS